MPSSGEREGCLKGVAFILGEHQAQVLPGAALLGAGDRQTSKQSHHLHSANYSKSEEMLIALTQLACTFCRGGRGDLTYLNALQLN